MRILYDSKYLRGRGRGDPRVLPPAQDRGDKRRRIRLAIFVGLSSPPISLVPHKPLRNCHHRRQCTRTTFPTSGSRCWLRPCRRALRAAYRSDLREVKQATESSAAMSEDTPSSHDEVGVYDEDAGEAHLQLHLCRSDLRRHTGERRAPDVEISFMPRKLASIRNAAPLLVQAERLAAQGLCQMGRLDPPFCPAPGRAIRHREDLQWYFEVWNEPNIDFWAEILNRLPTLRATITRSRPQVCLAAVYE